MRQKYAIISLPEIDQILFQHRKDTKTALPQILLISQDLLSTKLQRYCLANTKIVSLK
jgi:hypothetical protein